MIDSLRFPILIYQELDMDLKNDVFHPQPSCLKSIQKRSSHYYGEFSVLCWYLVLSASSLKIKISELHPLNSLIVKLTLVIVRRITNLAMKSYVKHRANSYCIKLPNEANLWRRYHVMEYILQLLCIWPSFLFEPGWSHRMDSCLIHK